MLCANANEFEMLDEGKVLVVYLDKGYYGCGSWQVSGNLCKHGASCINFMRLDLVPYVDSSLIN